MLMKDVCKECMLTKKAVEYYEDQGLISPRIADNGYRCFNREDMARLRKIAALRKLDLSIADIRSVLEAAGGEALREVVHRKELDLEFAELKHNLLEQLSRDGDWESVYKELDLLDKKQTITQKLLQAFPGYYGRYISFHFAGFLDEPIVTAAQQEAFHTIIEFLDLTDELVLPVDLQELLDVTTRDMGIGVMRSISEEIKRAVDDMDQYMQDHREELELMIDYKNSDEYVNSPVCRLQNLLKEFNHVSGYNDVFIPAMKHLSRSYHDYSEKLKKADNMLLERYPEVNKWYQS